MESSRPVTHPRANIMEQQNRRSSRRHHREYGIPSSATGQSQRSEDQPNPPRVQYTSTIRTVTPESIPEDDVLHPLFQDDGLASLASSTAASPRSVGPREASPRVQAPRVMPLRSSSDDRDIYMASRSGRDSHNRPRTRTLEERSRDKSPPTLYARSRHRIGSVHSTVASFSAGPEDTVTSIGHPSTIPAFPSRSVRLSHSHRERLVHTPPRRASAEQMRTAEPTPERELDLVRKPVAVENRQKLLYLMRSTCGRMEGMLAFRRGSMNPWSASYCSIDDETGSLVYEPKSDASHYRTLVPDLRGCNVKGGFDSESQLPYLDVSPLNSNLEVHLRPHSSEEYEQWYAAFLCWQPIKPKGIHNKMAKSQAPINSSTTRPALDGRRHSEVSLHQIVKEAPIIKVGKMIFWDTNVSYSNQGVAPKNGSRPKNYRIQGLASRRWKRVSCTLRENGELKLYSEADVTLVTTVQLSQLSRCAVQRLDPSVLDSEFCIAIYPQYTSTSDSLSLLRPVFLSLESRVLYEVWIVLLRAFTIPQLYGPKLPSPVPSPGLKSQSNILDDMFRMERSLSVRVIEAKLLPPVSPTVPNQNTPSSSRPFPLPVNIQPGGYYVEVQLDGEIRAKTMIKEDEQNPFWREDFEFNDLPAVLSAASLVLKKRPPSRQPQSEKSHREHHRTMHHAFREEQEGDSGGLNFDQFMGKADIYLDDLEEGKEIEKWWTLLDPYGMSIGEILVRVQAEEGVILMAKDYAPLSELLHRFSNGLTMQIAQMVPQQLKRLSECLLNIFQVSGEAAEWIMSLVEEEIDGTIKETPVSRLRFSRRIGSSDSSDSLVSVNDREQLVRDLGRNATLEANLLFRGNTLLTKALDFHMKRLGKEYLEDTIGDKLKEIADKDLECEVDPNRLGQFQDVERNWKRLISHTEDLWNCIAASATRCPMELRLIFRHIRGCAEDRYGDFLRTVRYSSVSGFLFLRFFCPAVLNPKLFGLLKDHPKPKARRTLTLITKGLQGLANISNFGAKEQWMEPMNAFLNNHRQSFRDFVDSVCSVSPASTPAGHSLALLTPSYSTPIQILGRLPPTSREGFPSLPYLIDHAKNFAALVEIWLEGTKVNAQNIQSTDGDLLAFHKLCVTLNQRTKDCLNKAERAERPTSNLGWQWEELVDRLDSVRISDSAPGESSANSDAMSVSSIATNTTRTSVRTPLASRPKPVPIDADTTASAPAMLPPSNDSGPPTPPPRPSFDVDETTPPSTFHATGPRSRSRDGSVRDFSSTSNVSSDAEGTTALPRFMQRDSDNGSASGPYGSTQSRGKDKDKEKDKDKHAGWYWGQSMKAYKKKAKEAGKEKEYKERERYRIEREERQRAREKEAREREGS